MNKITIELNGYWGKKSAYVKGELNNIKIDIERESKIQTDRPGHIELLNDTMIKNGLEKDKESYNSINGKTIDICDMKNWIKMGNAIVLKTGKTSRNYETHMTMIFDKKLNYEQSLQIIKNVLKKRGYNI
jgi:hypothetical protein